MFAHFHKLLKAWGSVYLQTLAVGNHELVLLSSPSRNKGVFPYGILSPFLSVTMAAQF